MTVFRGLWRYSGYNLPKWVALQAAAAVGLDFRLRCQLDLLFLVGLTVAAAVAAAAVVEMGVDW